MIRSISHNNVHSQTFIAVLTRQYCCWVDQANVTLPTPLKPTFAQNYHQLYIIQDAAMKLSEFFFLQKSTKIAHFKNFYEKKTMWNLNILSWYLFNKIAGTGTHEHVPVQGGEYLRVGATRLALMLQGCLLVCLSILLQTK